MDWANERWVRLYTRDTTTWKMLDWRARTVLMHLLRKVDRAGVLEVGDTGTMGLAAVLELPLEIVEPGIELLLHPRLRVAVETPTAYVLPKYLDAQEAVQTTNHRSAEYRARKRDFALAAAKPAIAELVRLPDGVTPRDGAVTKRDASITRGHATSPMLDVGASGRGNPPIEIDPPDSETVTKRDADTTPRDASITRHHATSQHVTPILSDPKDLSPPARTIPPSAEPSTARETGPNRPAPGTPPPGERQEARVLWRELEQARAEAAAELGVEAQPLTIGDIGERDLADMVAAARARGPAELAKLVGQARHAIAMAKAETVNGEKPFEWFTGAVFAERNFRRLAGKVATPTVRAGPKGSAVRAVEPPPRKIKNLTRP